MKNLKTQCDMCKKWKNCKVYSAYEGGFFSSRTTKILNLCKQCNKK